MSYISVTLCIYVGTIVYVYVCVCQCIYMHCVIIKSCKVFDTLQHIICVIYNICVYIIYLDLFSMYLIICHYWWKVVYVTLFASSDTLRMPLLIKYGWRRILFRFYLYLIMDFYNLFSNCVRFIEIYYYIIYFHFVTI